jgi:hypothetical protein
VRIARPDHRVTRRTQEAGPRVRIGGGELTRLNAGQSQVHRIERRAAADGIITRGERRRIEQVQDRENRAIRRLKHNARSRG